MVSVVVVVFAIKYWEAWCLVAILDLNFGSIDRVVPRCVPRRR